MKTRALFLFLSLSLLSAPGRAAMQQNTGIVRAVRGKASWSMDGQDWKPLNVGAKLGPGATIRSQAGSSVDVFLGDNGPIVRVNESSRFAIHALGIDRSGVEAVVDTQLEVLEGRVQGNVKKLGPASKYVIKFPGGEMAIRGTRFDIAASGKLDVIEGLVLITYNGVEPVAVSTGQTALPPKAPGEKPRIERMAPSQIEEAHISE